MGKRQLRQDMSCKPRAVFQAMHALIFTRYPDFFFPVRPQINKLLLMSGLYANDSWAGKKKKKRKNKPLRVAAMEENK